GRSAKQAVSPAEDRPWSDPSIILPRQPGGFTASYRRRPRSRKAGMDEIGSTNKLETITATGAAGPHSPTRETQKGPSRGPATGPRPRGPPADCEPPPRARLPLRRTDPAELVAVADREIIRLGRGHHLPRRRRGQGEDVVGRDDRSDQAMIRRRHHRMRRQ